MKTKLAASVILLVLTSCAGLSIKSPYGELYGLQDGSFTYRPNYPPRQEVPIPPRIVSDK